MAQLKNKNLLNDESIVVNIASMDHRRSISKLQISLSDVESRVIFSQTTEVRLDKKLNKEEILLNHESLNSGTYEIVINTAKDTILKETLCIHPAIDFDKIQTELYENKNTLSSGVINTLQFELNQIENKLENLKTYETGENILEDWHLFHNKFESFTAGMNPYHEFKKPYRRAFKSKYDDTYQPYTLKLPKNYNPKKQYPLLVYMHGSGKDEQGMLDRDRSDGNFIEIAPLARDIYRAYAEDYSQKDIIEAIDDVIEYFSVDTSKIIIGGFSMGGYGALRTYYEHPELYKGVVVHAGHPNLANEWLDGEHPNFLDEKYLASFQNIPVFIYHGRKDAAINVKLIEKMSEKLMAAGAIVTTSIVDEKGHEYPDEQTNQLYFKWLQSVIN